MKLSKILVRGIIAGTCVASGLLYVQLTAIPLAIDHDGSIMTVPSVPFKSTTTSCHPVEENVPFPYRPTSSGYAINNDASSCQRKYAHTIFPDHDDHPPSFSCSFCGQTAWTRYLSQVSQVLRSQFEDKCQDLVVYSAAFGSQHESYIAGSNVHGDTQELLDRHGPCFFAFVLESSVSNKTSSENPTMPNLHRKGLDGLTTFIPVPIHVLPYQNSRRNIKLLKLYGGFHVFSFARYLIWEDAKLQKKQWINIQGLRNYTRYVEQNLHRPQACLSVKSMPLHETSLGSNRYPQFQSHCQVLLAPTEQHKGRLITDSRDAIQRQCEIYEGYQQSLLQHQFQKQTDAIPTTKVRSVSLDSGLIDSAILAWDNHREECQRFNRELSCRWLSEIHCHGDRDQISFPHVLQTMGVTQQGHVVHPRETATLDKLLYGRSADGTWVPRIHMGRSACHWYSQTSMFTCPSNIPGTHKADKVRLAIVVAGTLERYHLAATIHHLLRPLARDQDHEVDTYLSLSVEAAPAFRSDEEYVKHLTKDPLFDVAEKNNRRPSPKLWQDFIHYHMSHAGATPRYVNVKQQSPDLSQEPRIERERQKARQQFPSKDVDQRFPILDMRRLAKYRTANANRNILTVFLELQQLWKKMIAMETELGVPYDFVLFLRDDARFLEDFDLDKLLRSAKDERIDTFILACDTNAMHPLEVNDYGGLYRRTTAEIYGNYFDEFFRDGLLKNCSASLDSTFRQGGRRGCNSEMLLRWILVQEHNLTMRPVGQALFPFQRSFHVQLHTASGERRVVPCFHKYCQSQEYPLMDGNMTRCQNLAFQ